MSLCVRSLSLLSKAHTSAPLCCGSQLRTLPNSCRDAILTVSATLSLVRLAFFACALCLAVPFGAIPAVPTGAGAVNAITVEVPGLITLIATHAVIKVGSYAKSTDVYTPEIPFHLPCLRATAFGEVARCRGTVLLE